MHSYRGTFGESIPNLMSTDWIPVELMTVGKRNMVRWTHVGRDVRFVEPFFRQTVAALAAANAVQKLTPVDALLDAPPTNPPRGFIFHVARCGSTLVSRSLGAVANHRVISEPSPVNQLLLNGQFDPQRKAQLLRGLVHALGGSVPGTPVVFKFSSWNVMFLEQILATFPTTPWAFVYREPAGVLRSLSAQPPNWLTNPQLAQLMGNPHASASERLLFAEHQLFEAPLRHWSRQAKAFNYVQLPAAVPEVAAHFGLALDARQREAMMEVGRFDAKQSGAVPFSGSARAPLPDGMLQAMAPLNLLYSQWEQRRISDAG